MAIYQFHCPECDSFLEAELAETWVKDQAATAPCQSAKRDRCKVYCTGESAVPAEVPREMTMVLKEAATADQAARVAVLELTIATDKQPTRITVAADAPQTYGRKSDFDACDYPLDVDDKKMSRVHFRIERRLLNRQPVFLLNDMGSTHGTTLTRRVGLSQETIQLFANKTDPNQSDTICLEHNDLIVAGLTQLRFMLETPSQTTIITTPSLPTDPNQTSTF
jgi:FHA domain